MLRGKDYLLQCPNGALLAENMTLDQYDFCPKASQKNMFFFHILVCQSDKYKIPNILRNEKCVLFLFSDNSRKWLERVGFFKNYEESIFPLIVFEISVMEKIFRYFKNYEWKNWYFILFEESHSFQSYFLELSMIMSKKLLNIFHQLRV